MDSHQSLLSFEQAESGNSLGKADTFLRSEPSRNCPGHRRFRGKPGVGWRGTDLYYLTLGSWRSHPPVPGYSSRGVS